MSPTFRIAALTSALSMLASLSALAQTSEMTSTKTTQKKGVIQAVYGNHVVVKEPDGTREYTVPEGFKFQMNGKDLTVDQLQPGMKVSATINEQTTTREVTTTKVVSGQVMQVAPGGVVVKAPNGELKSYDVKDAQGRDVTIVRNGKEIPLTDLKVGDKLNATIVCRLKVAPRSVAASVSPAPQPPPRLPHGGARRVTSPFPWSGPGWLALASALLLRGLRYVSRAR
jgi:hypothetical protein